VPDGKDVNRSFPGNRHGSLASRVAYYLMQDVIPKIDYGIDFHTGGAARINYPQIRCMLKDHVNEELARAFHAPFTLDSKFRPGSLRQCAARLGKRILVYEGGESARFDEYAIEEGIKGTLRLMYHLKMREEAEPASYPNLIVKHSSWIRAGYSGIFLRNVEYGDKVQKNQELGSLNDPFGDFRLAIKSPSPGYVIGLNQNPIIHQGDALIHLALV
jgi:predicted deacylase